MIERYVIKTRNDEYLCYRSVTNKYYLDKRLNLAEIYSSVEEARQWIDVQVLKDSKYKSDIYKIVQALEFVERGA